MNIKIHFTASEDKKALKIYQKLTARYQNYDAEEATVIVAVGGDGFMLETLHKFINKTKPIYGINAGTIGFLMNEPELDDLENKLAKAKAVKLHPLKMTAVGVDGTKYEALALNEVSLFRQTRQAGHIKIKVDGEVRIKNLICDGVMVSTPAGSTAYNLSAHGSILPITSNLLALTPISPFRPRRWRGALLPHTTKFNFTAVDCKKRPLSATADFTEVRDVISVDVFEERKLIVKLLFDSKYDLEEKIIKEQFSY
ncbi:MAG: NAD kinase [Alphaproteobacteria bacterium]